MSNLPVLARSYLFSLLRSAHRALDRAMIKPNAPPEEIGSLKERIEVLDYILSTLEDKTV